MAGAGLTFNIAKGRVGEMFYRVDAGDPAASRLYWRVLAASGIENDLTLIDKDTFADVIAGTTNEVTNTNYAPITVTGADLTLAPDDTNDRHDYDVSTDPSWTAVAAGDEWAKLVLCYASVGSPTTSQLMPLVAQHITVIPDGSNITLQLATTGIWRAN